MIKHKWLWGALLCHYCILILFTAEIIPQTYKRNGYIFWFHQGGDNYGYYEQTQSILLGDFRPNKFPLGFPILTVPLMALLQPASHDELVEPVALLWSVILFPVGQWLLARFAQYFSHKRAVTALAVWLWTLFPLLTYIGLRVVWNGQVAEIAAVHMTWAQMLSDGPAALFTLLCALLLLRAHQRRYPPAHVFLLGLLCGFLMMIRLTGVLTLGATALVLLATRRPIIIALFLGGALIGFGPQLLYNWHFFGGPLTSGYSVLDELPPDGLLSLTYLATAINETSARIGWLLPIGFVVACALFAYGLRLLWDGHRMGTAFIGLWITSYIAFYSVYYYTWTGSLFRFLIPVLPALAVVGAALLHRLAIIATKGDAVDASLVHRH